MAEVFKKCEFLGFSPSVELKAIASRVLERMVSQSPSDATLSARLISTPEGGFRALLHLASHTFKIAAHADARNPIQALNDLNEAILRQIQEWRRKRFEGSENINFGPVIS